MFLTTARIIIARDGLERRPRSGLQSFPLGGIRHLRVEPGSGPSGRIVVSGERGAEIVSMFVETRALERARILVARGRLEILRRQRLGRSESGADYGPGTL
jgi:hypothetical protein